MDKSNPDANQDLNVEKLAQAYIPAQKQMGKLYDPFTTLEKGVKFEGLYSAGLRMWNLSDDNLISIDQSDMYNEICAIMFSCVDLNLYLDTHPGDNQALELYNSLGSELRTLKDKYEKSYGPLHNFGWSEVSLPFNWIASPWPWERGDY